MPLDDAENDRVFGKQRRREGIHQLGSVVRMALLVACPDGPRTGFAILLVGNFIRGAEELAILGFTASGIVGGGAEEADLVASLAPACRRGCYELSVSNGRQFKIRIHGQAS